MLTGPGHVERFTVGEREIVFALASLKSPAELYALTLRGGEPARPAAHERARP